MSATFFMHLDCLYHQSIADKFYGQKLYVGGDDVMCHMTTKIFSVLMLSYLFRI